MSWYYILLTHIIRIVSEPVLGGNRHRLIRIAPEATSRRTLQRLFRMRRYARFAPDQGLPGFEAALSILSQLLKAETADWEVRSTAYQLTRI